MECSALSGSLYHTFSLKASRITREQRVENLYEQDVEEYYHETVFLKDDRPIAHKKSQWLCCMDKTWISSDQWSFNIDGECAHEVSPFAKELLTASGCWERICFSQKCSSCLITNIPGYPYTCVHINSTNWTLWLLIKRIERLEGDVMIGIGKELEGTNLIKTHCIHLSNYQIIN